MTEYVSSSSSINKYISSSRFDFMAKLLYIKYYNFNKIEYFKTLYEKHILTFNGGWEYPGTKTNIKQFLKCFDDLIDRIKKNGFDKKYPIPIGNNNVIINGAHRLLICYMLKIEPIINIIDSEIGCCNYNYQFFLNRKGDKPKLERKYADTMALEYIKHNKNIRAMIVYPIVFTQNKLFEIFNIINQYGYIYYNKTVQLTNNGFNNLVKELYRGEKWIGGLFPPGYSPGGKSNLCISKSKDYPTILILIDMNDLSKCIELKEKCRKIFNLGKNSLHISDYTNDTFRISSSLLNENSIHFLNNGTNDISSNTKEYLNMYFDSIKDNNDDYCLTSSLILELYNIRKSKDIDYLHKNDYELNIPNIDVHKGKWLSYYNENKSDIIYNPDNHFYINGYKFAKIEVIKNMKINRNELKDRNDLILINKTFSSKNIINIKFECSWGETSCSLLEKYKLFNKNNNTTWKNIICDPSKKIDYIICLDNVPNYIKKENYSKIICFPREPTNRIKIYNPPILKNFTYDNLFHVVTYPQFINKNYDDLIKLEYNEKQHSKIFSSIISNKKNGNGYILRRNVLLKLSKKYPELCDMYGSGWNNELGKSYKGELGFYHNKNKHISNTKYDALINYKYSLCIENCSLNNYFTEKITDTILCWCVPIYYGCPNISKYFPEHSYYYVDITKPDYIEEIEKIISREITQENINALTKARKLILDKYNIWNVISECVL